MRVGHSWYWCLVDNTVNERGTTILSGCCAKIWPSSCKLQMSHPFQLPWRVLKHRKPLRLGAFAISISDWIPTCPQLCHQVGVARVVRCLAGTLSTLEFCDAFAKSLSQTALLTLFVNTMTILRMVTRANMLATVLDRKATLRSISAGTGVWSPITRMR